MTVQLTGFKSWTETELAPWSSPWDQAEARLAPEVAAGCALALPVLLPVHSPRGLPWERFLTRSLDKLAPQSLLLQNLGPPGEINIFKIHEELTATQQPRKQTI